MKKIAICVLLISALGLAGIPRSLEAKGKPQAAPDIPQMPSFEFKNKSRDKEKWLALFIEGKKAGWIHQVVSRVKLENKENAFLFEQEIVIRLKGIAGVEKRDITYRALTTTDYMMIAFEMVDNAPDIKVGDMTGLKIVHTGVSKIEQDSSGERITRAVYATREVNGKKNNCLIGTRQTKNLMPDFAAVEIFRRSRMLGNAKETMAILDTTNLTMKTTKFCYRQKVKVKYGGGEKEMNVLDFSGDTYLFNNSKEMQAIRNQSLPVTARRVSGAGPAKSPGGTDPDYIQDPALKRGEYRNEEIGVHLKRPHDNWALRTHNADGYVSTILMAGMVDPIFVTCRSIRNIPEDITTDDTKNCLTYIITADLALEGLKPKVSNPRASKDDNNLKRYSGILTAKKGEIEHKGKYFYFIKDDRAMAVSCLVPGELYDENMESLMERLADNIHLSRVKPVPAVKFESKAMGVTAKSLHPSWTLAENPNGTIDITNIWLTVRGGANLMRTKRGPQDSLDKLSRIMRGDLSKKKFNVDKIRNRRVNGKSAKEFHVSFNHLGIPIKMKVFLVASNRYVYTIYLPCPAEIFDMASGKMDDFIGTLTLE